MENQPYDAAADTQGRPEYEREMAEVHRALVAAGLITPQRKQKVDLELVQEFLRLRGSEDEDGLRLLTKLQDDLDDGGCAEVTFEFILRMDDLMMELATDEVAAEMIADDSDPLGRGVGLVITGRIREAVRAFDEAIESGEYGSEVYLERGNAFRLLGDHGRSLADLDRYLDSRYFWRRPTAFVWRAEALAALGRTEGAVQSLADAVADLGSNPDPGNTLKRGPELTPEEREFNRRGDVANELRYIAETTKEFESSNQIPPDLRPLLEEVKAGIVRLREQCGF